jgi:3-deoxy-D-manno-octulosonic-acid transferase
MAVCHLTFIGGSPVLHGGHNILEVSAQGVELPLGSVDASERSRVVETGLALVDKNRGALERLIRLVDKPISPRAQIRKI